jgi:RNA polymerase sigma factor (sigma-70 family)
MTDPSMPSDSELMQRIAQQDQTALSALYERYGTPVYSLAYRILNNAHLAEEVTQDTFLKVWRGASGWDASKGRLSSWLLTVARYTAIDRLRQEQRQSGPGTTALDEVPPLVSASGLPDDPRRQDGRLLRELLQKLPEEQTAIIELAFFQGWTHRQLAERLNLPLGTVKTRARLGLQKLRKLWIEATRTEESS